MDVDQTGDDICAVQIDGVGLRLAQNIGKLPVLDGKRTGNKAKLLGVEHGIFKIHLVPP